MSILFFNSCVCVSECSRQRDIHGTSISSLMYCKYYLFCAAYININIWVSEYPTHSSGPWQQAWASHSACPGFWIWLKYEISPVARLCRGMAAQKGFAFCFRWWQNVQIVNKERGLAGSRCGLDYPPFFLSGMIDSVIKSVYCYSKHQRGWGWHRESVAPWVETWECLCQAIINIQQTLGTIWEGDYIGLRFNELIIDVTL